MSGLRLSISSARAVFRDHRILTKKMKQFFKGLHQRKEPFTFSLYRAVSKALLCSTKKQGAFAHALLVICWNRMCYAKSVGPFDKHIYRGVRTL
uniref:Uncharacterized protein n=1 Tax=Globisporangium ultimum (strain ATCC 200006 / CBS 805.95 / DAOM BR144) TaxID=431595 RepID=K3XCB5_GLOUD